MTEVTKIVRVTTGKEFNHSVTTFGIFHSNDSMMK